MRTKPVIRLVYLGQLQLKARSDGINIFVRPKAYLYDDVFTWKGIPAKVRKREAASYQKYLSNRTVRFRRLVSPFEVSSRKDVLALQWETRTVKISVEPSGKREYDRYITGIDLAHYYVKSKPIVLNGGMSAVEGEALAYLR